MLHINKNVGDTTKKFINSVENAEKEMIEGMLKAYPDKMTELDCGAVLVRKNKKTNAPSIDKNTPAYAVSKYNSARSNLLLALIFTVANMLLGALGSGVYMLFSIYFPYCMFDITDIVWSIPALAVLALFVVYYIFSKKKSGFMIAALVTFILDFLFLFGYSILVSSIPELEITLADFLIDYLTHIWVLVYLIIGVRYSKRYKAAINQNPELVSGSIFANAALPAEMINPEENPAEETVSTAPNSDDVQ